MKIQQMVVNTQPSLSYICTCLFVCNYTIKYQHILRVILTVTVKAQVALIPPPSKFHSNHEIISQCISFIDFLICNYKHICVFLYKQHTMHTVQQVFLNIHSRDHATQGQSTLPHTLSRLHSIVMMWIHHTLQFIIVYLIPMDGYLGYFQCLYVQTMPN